MSGIDWPGLLRLALGRLGMTPEAFWRLTPAEFVLILGEPAAVRPLDRGRLEELARLWPDRPGPAEGD